MSSSLTKNRINFIDLAKGFCIILVVFHHICVLTNFKTSFDVPLGSFRMPLYYILSGLFFKEYNGFIDFIIKKTNKLLIPFLFFFFITSFLLPIAVKSYFEFRGLQNNILDALFAFIFEKSYPNNPIWFLMSLFETNIMFYLVIILAKKIKSSFYRSFFIVSLSIIIGGFGFTLNVLNINIPLYIDSSLSCLPFFMFGYMLYRKTSFLYPNKYDKFNWLFCICCLIFLLMFAEPILVIQNKYTNFLSFYLCGIIGTLLVLTLSKEINILPFISYWGRYSIMILLTHSYIIRIIMVLFNKIQISNIYVTFIALLLTMFLYQLIIPLMKRYLPYFTAQKDLIKS